MKSEVGFSIEEKEVRSAERIISEPSTSQQDHLAPAKDRPNKPGRDTVDSGNEDLSAAL